MRIRVRLRPPEVAEPQLLVGDPPEPVMPSGPVEMEAEEEALLDLASRPLLVYRPAG
jgi:hypothetical protein